jgi:pimeloyl-ACP methyl ester carboxylesterase
MSTTRSEIELDVHGIKCRIHYLVQDGPANAPVILLLHGHSSSVAEFDDLLPALEGKAVVFAFDQPSCGKSGEITRQPVLDFYRPLAWARHYEALFYLRDLVHAFAWGVIRPRVKASGRRVRVAGGSLGGNLTLLVAERKPKFSWLEAAYCWSPGSAWGPSQEFALGGGPTRKRAERAWAEADKEPFLFTSYVEKATPIGKSHPQPWYWYFDCWGEDHHPECKKLGNGACSRCQHHPKLHLPPDKLLGPSDNYPKMSAKKARSIEGALLSTALAARPSRMAWHWEIAAEQLELSHRQLVAGGRRRIERLQCPTKFMAGREDRHFPVPLFQDTQACFAMALARRATDPTAARVSEQWFDATGHSVHNERPRELAQILAGAAL